MIWPLLICFSLLAVPMAGSALSGKIELKDSRNPTVRKKLDYSGVVVWLEPLNRSSAANPQPTPAKIVQKDKTFTPHVLAVTLGSSVEFPNLDPIFHNAFSNYDGQIFDIGLYPPGTSRIVRFSRPGVVRVFCNIHADMSAVIVVLNTPWFDTTKPDGSFAIQGVPPGEYRLRVFHERAAPNALDGSSRTVSVDRERIELPAIGISESGYLAIPHKNKYGQEYPPAPGEGGLYPSVRK